MTTIPDPDAWRGHRADAASATTTVRPWTRPDAEKLLEFVGSCSLETRHRRFHGLVRDDESILRRLAELPSNESATFVAEIADRIVATGSWVRDEDDRAELALMVSDRHQRQGLGSVLFDRLRTSVLDAGFAAMSAWLLESNGGAIAFLRAMAPAVVPRSTGGGAIQLWWAVERQDLGRTALRDRGESARL